MAKVVETNQRHRIHRNWANSYALMPQPKVTEYIHEYLQPIAHRIPTVRLTKVIQ